MFLNSSQELALKELHKFLADPEKKFITLDAPAGYGKTFLLNKLQETSELYIKRNKILSNIDISERYDFMLAASTNKAAANIPTGSTIFSTLGIIFNGTRIVDVKNKKYNSTLVADEYTFISEDLHEQIDKKINKCIYVGDSKQLLSPNFCPQLNDIPKISLTIPQRQDPNSPLFQLCLYFRSLVGNHNPIVIPHAYTKNVLNSNQLADHLKTKFTDDDFYICFTNKRAIMVNQYMRELAGYPSKFTVGEQVIFKSRTQSLISGRLSKVETKAHITKIYDKSEDGTYCEMDFSNNTRYLYPLKPSAIKAKMKLKVDTPKQLKDLYEKNFIDIRSAYAGTCHSAQGSTYRDVYIDLKDIRKCKDNDTLRRLLYTAVSRASREVYFYE